MRAEHLSGVPSARTHAAYMQACRTDADVPHAGKHLRAARKQNTPCGSHRKHIDCEGSAPESGTTYSTLVSFA